MKLKKCLAKIFTPLALVTAVNATTPSLVHSDEGLANNDTCPEITVADMHSVASALIRADDPSEMKNSVIPFLVSGDNAEKKFIIAIDQQFAKLNKETNVAIKQIDKYSDLDVSTHTRTKDLPSEMRQVLKNYQDGDISREELDGLLTQQKDAKAMEIKEFLEGLKNQDPQCDSTQPVTEPLAPPPNLRII